MYKELSNRPYIVVSSKNDLGGNDGDNFARLVLLKSETRGLDVLVKEVTEFKKEVGRSITADLKARKIKNVVSKSDIHISPKFNAIADTFLTQQQILDVLIKWANTEVGSTKETYLDLLDKKFTLIAENDFYNKPISVLDIIGAFRDTDKVLGGFKEILKAIKKSKSLNSNLRGEALANKMKEDVLITARGLKG
jgi:ribosomal protein L7Ae-like RNA K-turn-binding protein